MLCPTCGNPGDSTKRKCDFCGSDLGSDDSSFIKPVVVHKTVNLEHGRPLVESALKRMNSELDQARQQGVKVLTLIHGYGSSGKGGKIRIEGRKILDYLYRKGVFKSVVYGENFHKRSGIGKSLTRQYPELEKICRTDFNNPGVTIVVF